MTALRVLVAEDDAVIAFFLSQMISDMGYEVCTVVDSEAAAIKAAGQYRPDLMVLDARLGEGSGIAAATEILKNEDIPYLLITGERPSDLDLAAGAIVLQKPFQEADLALAMQHALDTVARRGRGLAADARHS